MDMKEGRITACKHPSSYKPPTREHNDSINLRATVDSDYARNTTQRNSVTGISIKIPGGCVYYKTRFKATLSLSSVEAEFIAACKAAKVILYIRSILHDIFIPHDQPTTMFEEN